MKRVRTVSPFTIDWRALDCDLDDMKEHASHNGCKVLFLRLIEYSCLRSVSKPVLVAEDAMWSE